MKKAIQRVAICENALMTHKISCALFFILATVHFSPSILRAADFSKPESVATEYLDNRVLMKFDQCAALTSENEMTEFHARMRHALNPQSKSEEWKAWLPLEPNEVKGMDAKRMYTHFLDRKYSLLVSAHRTGDKKKDFVAEYKTIGQAYEDMGHCHILYRITYRTPFNTTTELKVLSLILENKSWRARVDYDLWTEAIAGSAIVKNQRLDEKK